MKVLSDAPTSFFDVDSTLLMWDKIPNLPHIDMELFDGIDQVTIHQEHVDLLIKLKQRGGNIVVWSAGGTAWAEKVVKFLNIEKYVDIIVSKPSYIFDDCQPDVWLPKVRYLERRKYLTKDNTDVHKES